MDASCVLARPTAAGAARSLRQWAPPWHAHGGAVSVVRRTSRRRLAPAASSSSASSSQDPFARFQALADLFNEALEVASSAGPSAPARTLQARPPPPARRSLVAPHALAYLLRPIPYRRQPRPSRSRHRSCSRASGPPLQPSSAAYLSASARPT